MKDLKFRYRILDDHTGGIIKVVYNLKDIEIKDFKGIGTILSRDLFTGVKDKQGEEICNRDIIKADILDKWYLGEVVFCDASFSLKLTKIPKETNCYDIGQEPELNNFNSFEILGNIYENPELKDGKK